jgi:hypothetical protein
MGPMRSSPYQVTIVVRWLSEVPNRPGRQIVGKARSRLIPGSDLGRLSTSSISSQMLPQCRNCRPFSPVIHSWGKGYATEGSRALIQKGFRKYGLRRVFAMTMTVNIASRRVMEKAGLKFVRAFVLDWPDYVEGVEYGGVEYALYREEWEST